MLNKSWEKWSALPEVIRWILWLPAALSLNAVVTVTFSLLVYWSFWFARELASEISRTIIASTLLLPLIYFLIPRGKKVITSLVFGLNAVFCVLFIINSTRHYFSNDYLLSEEEGMGLIQCILWLVIGTGTYRACMRTPIDNS